MKSTGVDAPMVRVRVRASYYFQTPLEFLVRADSGRTTILRKAAQQAFARRGIRVSYPMLAKVGVAEIYNLGPAVRTATVPDMPATDMWWAR